MRGMAKCSGNSFRTVANTNHCKSLADSREPQRVLSHSVQEASQSPRCALQTAYLLPFHHLTLKNSFTLSLKIKNSGVLTAPLKLFNSGSVDNITTKAATTSNKVNLKNLEHLCGNCKGDCQPLRSLKHGGNKTLILKNVLLIRSCLLLLGLHHA